MGLMMIGATGLVGFKAAGPEEAAFQIKYEVKCHDCNINFRNAQGEPDQILDIDGTWEYSFTGKEGQFVYVSATNTDGSETKVVIKRGGKQVLQGVSLEAQKSARAGLIL